MHENPSTAIKNPGPVKVSPRAKQALIALGAAGLIVFVVGLKLDPTRAWSAWLLGYVFFLFWGLCGLFFTAVHHAAGASWSVVVRRIAEGMASYLPVALVPLVIMLLGVQDIYAWAHPEQARVRAPLGADKLAYLNLAFFSIRNFIFLGVWALFGWLLIKNSLSQDESGDAGLSKKSAHLSAAFLPIFGLTFTLAVFDLTMSLEPNWYSTIFGVYCFAGLFQSGMAFLAIVAIWLRRRGELAGLFNANHLQDIGNWMFAFSVFSAYIGFSQYMLIWYANLPDETFYLILRKSWPWGYLFLAVVFLKFFIPFFMLMGRDGKRNEKVVLTAASLIILGQFLDLYLMIGPVVSPPKPLIGWIELGTFVAFGSLFGICLLRFFGKHSILAHRDPKLAASVNWKQ
ncbi:MAG: molybdopterin oxidoreductase [Candidatus Zixiibacteriota bacterium]